MPQIKSYQYNIVIGHKALTLLNNFLTKNKYSRYFIICDENTHKYCLLKLISSCKKLAGAEIIEIESGESSKSINIATQIWQTLLENKAGKNALLVNLGGGVVSDLGGFCASVYKRGVDFINVPTSLLAMADASVGGKNGIDFNNTKNSIGTFAQPKAVFIYPDFLMSLDFRHKQNGMAEVYKMALIADKKLWQALKKNTETDLESIITKNVILKNKIVLKDPFDKGIRKVLNFGHTIGHAIEAHHLNSQNELLHGEALVVGMIVESHLSLQKKLITKTDFKDITQVLQSSFRFNRPKKLNWEELQPYLLNDKKKEGNDILFSLIKGIGACDVNVPVNKSQIETALQFYNSLPE